MTTLPTARDIMTSDTLTVRRHDPVLETAQRMLAQGVSTAPVVEPMSEAEFLVGFVSEKDVMQCLASGRFHARPDIAIQEIMRPHPVCVRPAADILALAAIFMQHGFRHLPVVEGRVLLGMVSRRDVIRGMLDHYDSWKLGPSAGREIPDLGGIFTPQYLVG